MGQREVYNLLASNLSQSYNSHEIALILNDNLNIVQTALRKLKKAGWIKIIQGEIMGSGHTRRLYQIIK